MCLKGIRRVVFQTRPCEGKHKKRKDEGPKFLDQGDGQDEGGAYTNYESLCSGGAKGDVIDARKCVCRNLCVCSDLSSYAQQTTQILNTHTHTEKYTQLSFTGKLHVIFHSLTIHEDYNTLTPHIMLGFGLYT